MTPNSIARNRTAAVAQNMNVRIPNDFVEGAQYVTIAGLATVNGGREPAISQYLTPHQAEHLFLDQSADQFSGLLRRHVIDFILEITLGAKY